MRFEGSVFSHALRRRGLPSGVVASFGQPFQPAVPVKGWYSTDEKATWSTTDKNLASALSRVIPEEIEPRVDVSKPFVVVESGMGKGAMDISGFVELTPDGRWKPRTLPAARPSWDKVEDGFVFTASNGGTPRHYKVTYPHRPNHALQRTEAGR